MENVLMESADYRLYIEIDPGKRFGKPCIKGTRIAVADVLEMLASGMSEKEILQDHPNLSKEQIRAALLYASDSLGKGAA
ncbi:DUF433 domain-containing protein [Endozoicomonas gorgoniicola]|uniref:DUF433 domain-containing protein n=1 Tax=Endozoicomonas gorgoniicola TaxID=1234144 RepID=A0ABT3MV27_9GAMM|nr:DUF433 domain-containing protein [Endozoicomonas gorgoniicola]MCW7553239.1 DUF433 domain-containing protein [Endozoicomonas gorgoniicola]